MCCHTLALSLIFLNIPVPFGLELWFPECRDPLETQILRPLPRSAEAATQGCPAQDSDVAQGESHWLRG